MRPERRYRRQASRLAATDFLDGPLLCTGGGMGGEGREEEEEGGWGWRSGWTSGSFSFCGLYGGKRRRQRGWRAGIVRWGDGGSLRRPLSPFTVSLAAVRDECLPEIRILSSGFPKLHRGGGGSQGCCFMHALRWWWPFHPLLPPLDLASGFPMPFTAPTVGGGWERGHLGRCTRPHGLFRALKHAGVGLFKGRPVLMRAMRGGKRPPTAPSRRFFARRRQRGTVKRAARRPGRHHQRQAHPTAILQLGFHQLRAPEATCHGVQRRSHPREDGGSRRLLLPTCPAPHGGVAMRRRVGDRRGRDEVTMKLLTGEKHRKHVAIAHKRGPPPHRWRWGEGDGGGPTTPLVRPCR